MNPKEILSKNLQKYLDQRGITQTKMANDLGFPEMTVSNWMKKKTYPRVDRLQQMADYFNVSRSDLTELKPSNLIEISQETIKIPVLGEISCGKPLLVEENIVDYRYAVKDNTPPGTTFYLQAKGDSMYPVIPNGSMVLVRHQNDAENGEIVAAIFDDHNEATLKRMRKQGDTIMLLPDNNEYEPIISTEDNPVRILGKAIKVEMDL